MADAMGLRERKKVRTRQALVDAALHLFAERGYEPTTVEDIASAADVSPRTFFRYFATKEDAVFADHHERLSLLRGSVEAREPDEPVHRTVRRAILTLVGQQTAGGVRGMDRVRLVTSEPPLVARSLEYQAQYEEIVAQAVAERLGADPDRDVRARIVAGAAFGALRAAMRAWATSDGSLDPLEAATHALDVLDEGLGGALGRP